MSLKLIKLSYEYKDQLIEMIDEWKEDIIKNNTNRSPWTIFKNDCHDFDYYLEHLELKEASENRVPDSVYFCLDEDRNRLVGAINIRHYLNYGLYNDGGHIGDGIRPSERKKGYATKMIGLALDKCKELGLKRVLICCDKDNIGSKKSIINNGGVLENEVIAEDNTIEQRYWIELDSSNRLEGKNIVLRKAKTSDLEAILKNIWSDESVYRTMWFKPTFDLEEAKQRMFRTINYQSQNDAYFVALKDSDEAIGLCAIREDKDGVYDECGLCIASKYQGKGYGKEMLSLLLDLVFNKYYAKAFTYDLIKDNQKSRNLMNSYAFKYVKTTKEIREWDDQEFELDTYILSKEDYKK